MTSVSVGNGGHAFRGDRRLLATVSPNGDGLRDRAVVRFRAMRAAAVTVAVLRTRGRGRSPELVWRRTVGVRPGLHRVVWRPKRTLAARTYLVELTAVDSIGTRFVIGRRYRHDWWLPAGPVVRILGIDAGFVARSYPAGALATLTVATDASRLTFQTFRAGPERVRLRGDDRLSGTAVDRPSERSWAGHRSAPRPLRIRVPHAPSGLYFVRLAADDGRRGFAPLIIRPSSPSRNDLAVVLPTNTWQAYNHRDADGDGWGDTWYAAERIGSVDLTRPQLNRGTPPYYRLYVFGFLRWLHWTGKQVDFLSDEDLAAFGTGDRLAAQYRLVVFLGPHEYVTTRAYDVVKRFRDLGGDLMFTSATNLLWRVRQRGRRIFRAGRWRDLGRPEAAVVGVQYRSNDGGVRQGRYVVVGANDAPWAFRGTGLVAGERFGHGGIELDARTRASPPSTLVLARMPRLHRNGASAEMAYYETSAGARVFAAGTLNFAGSLALLEPPLSTLLENVWTHLLGDAPVGEAPRQVGSARCSGRRARSQGFRLRGARAESAQATPAPRGQWQRTRRATFDPLARRDGALDTRRRPTDPRARRGELGRRRRLRNRCLVDVRSVDSEHLVDAEVEEDLRLARWASTSSSSASRSTRPAARPRAARRPTGRAREPGDAAELVSVLAGRG